VLDNSDSDSENVGTFPHFSQGGAMFGSEENFSLTLFTSEIPHGNVRRIDPGRAPRSGEPRLAILFSHTPYKAATARRPAPTATGQAAPNCAAVRAPSGVAIVVFCPCSFRALNFRLSAEWNRCSDFNFVEPFHRARHNHDPADEHMAQRASDRNPVPWLELIRQGREF